MINKKLSNFSLSLVPLSSTNVGKCGGNNVTPEQSTMYVSDDALTSTSEG